MKAGPHVLFTRYRVGFGGKLVLQVLVEVSNDYYYQMDPAPGTKPTCNVWRDAKLEDISALEHT